MATKNICIVGAGVAGLHLGLHLLSKGHKVTLHTPKSAKDVAAGRLLNTVAHHHHTRTREKELGVNHWDGVAVDYSCHHHYIAAPNGALRFRGDFAHNSIAIDYRLYIPRLMQDFVDRGGSLNIRNIERNQLEELSEAHDLVAVASGHDGLASIFATDKEHASTMGPQRLLCAGLYEGVGYPKPVGVTLSISAGHGELIEIPFYSFGGQVTALLFECIPNGDMSMLNDPARATDPAAFSKLVLEKLEKHHPDTFARIDKERFRLARPQDLLQGSVTPIYREWSARLSNGKLVMAVGDAQSRVDPVCGQGANVCSYQAWTLGELIDSSNSFDVELAREYKRRAEAFTLGAFDWTNFTLNPPPPYFINLLGAMSQNNRLANDFTSNFNHPDLQWQNLRSESSVQQFMARA